MQAPRHVVGKRTLRRSFLGLMRHRVSEVCDVRARHQREELQVPLDVRVVHVDPVLIKAERGRHPRVEPNVAPLRLPELRTRRVGDEGEHDPERAP